MAIASIEDIFEQLGGPAAVGRAIGKSTEHAATMKRRGSFHVRYWPSLITACQTKGLTLNEADLVRMHNARVQAVVKGAAA